MVDMRVIVICILSCASAFGAEENVKMWEDRCLVTHNKLRGARGLDPVSRSSSLKDVADLKGLYVVMDDYNMHINGISSLKADELQTDHISFNFEILSKTIALPQAPNLRDFQMQLYMTMAAEDMITKWYEHGLFFPDKKERLNKMMDPAVDKIGCVLHYVPHQGNIYKIYLVVAYKQNPTKLNKINNIASGQNLASFTRSSSADRACNIDCTDAGSCYSHKHSKIRLGSRVGGDRTVAQFNSKSREACRCEFDAELWELGTKVYKETPVCAGPCFVYCPFAKAGSKTSCNGETRCTCKYAEGGASCE